MGKLRKGNNTAAAPWSALTFRPRLARGDMLLGAGVGVFLFCVYALTAAPTVTGEDAGELGAAAWTLGIAHPPGYPLYMLLGKAAMALSPFADKAFALNLLSGLAAAAAVALFVLLALRLGASRPAAAAAGLAAALTPTLWSQATIAEVYTLAALLLAVICTLLVRYLFQPEPLRLLALAYVFGLGLTGHPALILLAPGLCLAVAIRSPGVLKDVRMLCGVTFFALLGFALYLYLPIRSFADPVMDWGDPETVGGFLAHVLRSQYTSITDESAPSFLDYVLYCGRVVLVDVGPLLALAAAAGVRSLLRFPGSGTWPAERRRATWAFGASYVLWLSCFSLGLLFVLTISFQKQTLALNQVFFVPLVLLLVPAAANGIDRAAEWLSRRLPAALSRPAVLTRAFASVLPVGLLLWHFPSQNRGAYTIARDYARAILTVLPPNAVYVPSGDYATFPVLYLQLVEGLRPDVIVADKYGYLDPRFLGRLGASPRDIEDLKAMPRAAAERWLIDRAGRPVFVNSKRAILEIPTDRFQPFGLLYRVDRERAPLSPEAEDRIWAACEFWNLDGDYRWVRGNRDLAADFILAEVLIHRAEMLFDRKQSDAAVGLLTRLRDIADGYRELLQNVGSLLWERGFPKEAAPLYEAALAVDSDYAQARRNYARLLLEIGAAPERAIAVAERSRAEMPADAQFLKALAKVYRGLGKCAAASQAYLEAAFIDKGDADALKLAGEIAEKDLKDAARAKELFARSLARRPTQPDLIEKVHGSAARKKYEEAAKKALDSMLGPSVPGAPAIGIGQGEAGGMPPGSSTTDMSGGLHGNPL